MRCTADLGSEGGSPGRVWEEPLLGVTCTHLPWGADCCVKVVVPVLVKLVGGVGYCVNQAIVQDLWRSCSVKRQWSSAAVCSCNDMLCMVQHTALAYWLLRAADEMNNVAPCEPV